MTLKAKEDSVAKLTGVLKDEDGNTVAGSSLTSMVLYLYDAEGNIINSQNGTDILNANGGSVDESGNWELLLTASDNPIITPGRTMEGHTAVIKWVWAGKQSWEEIEFWVKDLAYVPVS